MAREFFKNLPDTTTPLNAPRLNNFLNGNEAMGSIVVDDITCKNISPLSKISTISGGYINRTCGTLGKVTKGVTYTISFVCGSSHTGANSIQIRTYNTESITEAYTTYSSGNRIKSTFTASQDGEIYLSANLGTAYTNIIYDIQVEKGSVATDYVEHKEFSNKQIYTGEEQVVGTYWDKPLYRKQISVTTFPKNELKQVEHNITNLENIINIDGNLRLNYDNPNTPSKCRKVPLYWLKTNFNINFSIGETTLNFDSTHSTDVEVTAILILEYTKTTDTATTALEETE